MVKALDPYKKRGIDPLISISLPLALTNIDFTNPVRKISPVALSIFSFTCVREGGISHPSGLVPENKMVSYIGDSENGEEEQIFHPYFSDSPTVTARPIRAEISSEYSPSIQGWIMSLWTFFRPFRTKIVKAGPSSMTKRRSEVP